jgi:hypothetical protein
MQSGGRCLYWRGEADKTGQGNRWYHDQCAHEWLRSAMGDCLRSYIHFYSRCTCANRRAFLALFLAKHDDFEGNSWSQPPSCSIRFRPVLLRRVANLVAIVRLMFE